MVGLYVIVDVLLISSENAHNSMTKSTGKLVHKGPKTSHVPPSASTCQYVRIEIYVFYHQEYTRCSVKALSNMHGQQAPRLYQPL